VLFRSMSEQAFQMEAVWNWFAFRARLGLALHTPQAVLFWDQVVPAVWV
jgi:hypothetical protein